MNEIVKDNSITTLSFVIETLKEMTSDWDTDYDQQIGPKTRLIRDLGFESIDVVQLIVAFEEEFQSRELNFEQLLMQDGRYVDELVVEKVVDFLDTNLNAA
jgi:acyl carrier protein